MYDLPTLIARLDALEASIPELLTMNPAPGDFIMAFASEADLLVDNAGPYGAAVARRAQHMLAMAGLAEDLEPELPRIGGKGDVLFR